MDSPERSIILYALTDPDTGEVRYVGQTCYRSRCYAWHLALWREKSPKVQWWWGVVVLVALIGCAAELPPPPVTTPTPPTRPLAWVLWEEEESADHPSRWQLIAAYERRHACEEYLSSWADAAEAMPEARRRARPRVMFEGRYGKRYVRYVCLPDMIDPR